MLPSWDSLWQPVVLPRRMGLWGGWGLGKLSRRWATSHTTSQGLSAAVPGRYFYTAIYVSSPGPSASTPTSQGTERSVGALLPFISERECSSPLCVTNWHIRKPSCQTFVLRRAAPCTLCQQDRTMTWIATAPIRHAYGHLKFAFLFFFFGPRYLKFIKSWLLGYLL